MRLRTVTFGLGAAIVLASALSVRSGDVSPALDPLMRSFKAYSRDLERLDRVWTARPESSQTKPLRSLTAPAPGSLPLESAEVTIRERLPVSLRQAVNLALTNDPTLQQYISGVEEQSQWLRSVRGRFLPTFALEIGAGYQQQRGRNWVWRGNADVSGFGVDSPFYVPTGGSNRFQTNLGGGFAGARIDYELLSFERSAAVAEVTADLDEAHQLYGNHLRELQLAVSQAYYQLQLMEQLQRIRQVVVTNDSVILDQVRAMHTAGLVPRVDLLRAESRLQQQRFLLEQADAGRAAGQRRLSNLVNVPFDVTLETSDAVRLEQPWPLNLEDTIVRGLQDNPQLEALQAARNALLRQADRRAAQLLPSIGLFAKAGYQVDQSTSPVIDLDGCCKGPAFIPGFNSQGNDWSAGVQLNWRLFDGGITSGAVAANRAAADQVLQQQAAQRNAIRQALEAAFYEHGAALRQIIAANSAYQAAREAFRDSRARYEFGLADYTDLADTISSLTGAMEQRAEAMTLANLSYANLLRELLPVPRDPALPLSLPLTLPVAHPMRSPMTEH